MSYFNFELPPPAGGIVSAAGTIGLSLRVSGIGASTNAQAANVAIAVAVAGTSSSGATAVDMHDPGPVRRLSPAARRQLWRKAEDEEKALDAALAAKLAERRLLRSQLEVAARGGPRRDHSFDDDEDEAEVELLLMYG